MSKVSRMKEGKGWVLYTDKKEELKKCYLCNNEIEDEFYFCNAQNKAFCSLCDKGNPDEMCKFLLQKNGDHEHFLVMEVKNE